MRVHWISTRTDTEGSTYDMTIGRRRRRGGGGKEV